MSYGRPYDRPPRVILSAPTLRAWNVKQDFVNGIKFELTGSPSATLVTRRDESPAPQSQRSRDGDSTPFDRAISRDQNANITDWLDGAHRDGWAKRLA